MDPKDRNNKRPNLSPQQRLDVLRNLRDNNHCLRKPERPYDQDWFIGAVLASKLEQTYMNDINFNNRF